MSGSSQTDTMLSLLSRVGLRDAQSWLGVSWARRYGFHAAVLILIALVGLVPWELSPFRSLSLPQPRHSVPLSPDADQLRLANRRVVLPLPQPTTASVVGRAAVITTNEGQYPQYEPRVYVVQAGDTLSTLAQAFGISQKTLIWANESLVEHRDDLSLGQALTILPIDGALHNVMEGDSLAALAEKYKVGVEQITGYPGNDIPDDGLLVAGTSLVIPGADLPEPPVRVVPTPAPAQPVTRESQVVAGASGSGSMAWPLNGLLTAGYSSYHRAIDIHTKSGVPVTAADGGTVTLVSWLTYSYGYHVIIDHGNGVETLYAHLSAINVEAGQVVSQGEQVGLVGSTGRSTGPHLHFEVRVSGVQQNPFSYLP